ncbi:barstar family protein [Kribbella sp. NPDC059898]
MCASVAGLFDEFAATLQFPYCFGENWDGLGDCVSD